MSDDLYVLDASALLAVLLREPNAPKVYPYLLNAVVSAINFSEVVAKLQERGIPDQVVDGQLGKLGLVVIPFDEAQAYRAGRLRAVTRSAGLSFGDRACLALAAVEGATAITMDRGWAQLDLPIPILIARD